MISLVSSERRKLTSVRASWIVLAVLLALVGGELALILSGVVEGFDLTGTGRVQLVSTTPGAISIGFLLGMLVGAVDHRHGTHVPTYLLTPRRGRVLAAKLLTAFALGSLAAVVSAVIAIAIGLPSILGEGLDVGTVLGDPVFWARLLAGVVATALVAVFGAAVAALLRSILAAVLVFVGLGVVDVVLRAYGPAGLVEWMVFPSVDRLCVGPVTSAGDMPFWAGGLILLGWIAVVVIAATVRTLRTDVR